MLFHSVSVCTGNSRNFQTRQKSELIIKCDFSEDSICDGNAAGFFNYRKCYGFALLFF